MSSMRTSYWALVLMFPVGLHSALFAETLPEKGSAVRVATDFSRSDSLTGGIQEAIDSLPEQGGTVYIPAGTYVVHRTIAMRPNMKLIGAGRGTVIRKSPAFRVTLAEDVKKEGESRS